MANFPVIAAVGLSIEHMLQAGFEAQDPVAPRTTKVFLARTEDFKTPPRTISRPYLTVYLYRVDVNRAMRAAWSGIGLIDGRGHLALDLHFLLTPWAANAEFELRILGRAMELLEATPTLTGPMLHPSAEWAPGEAIQLLMGEITIEEIMRTFDSLPTDYRLSVPYLARLARLDTQPVVRDPRATTVVGGLTPSSVP